VDLAPVKALGETVSLETIKADKVLKEMPLVKLSRLSRQSADRSAIQTFDGAGGNEA